MDARMYLQNTATINGRNIWHYLVDTEVGQVNIIQCEKVGLEIDTTLIFNDYEKAEKKFESVCRQVINGKK